MKILFLRSTMIDGGPMLMLGNSGREMESSHKNHLISRKKLRVFCETHPAEKGAKSALDVWFGIAERGRWEKFADVKATFGKRVDKVGKFLVFDAGGNKYRIVVEIFYGDLDAIRTVILIRDVLTHREYDENRWKG